MNGLSREHALEARPLPAPLVGREETPDGGARLTVRLRRGRLQRLLGAPAEFDHTYELDAFGREVFDACDGCHRVHEIVRRFARDHALNRAEAEMAVTAFLRTLVAKGLVAMAFEDDAPPEVEA